MFEIGVPQEMAARDRLGGWLERDDLKRIVVDQIGRGGRQTQIRGSDLFPEVIEHMPEPKEQSVLEAILLAHGSRGGTIQIRAEFHPAAEGETPPSSQKFRIGLAPTSPGSKTGSKGADAAAESLASSLQKVTSSVRESNEELTGRLVDVLQGHQTRQEGSLRDQMNMSHSYNAEILRLHMQVQELKSEIRIRDVIDDQSQDPSVMMNLIKDIIPVAGDALSSLVASWNGKPQIAPAPEAPAPAPAPEAAPQPPA
mgnify:FL=1